MPRGAIAGLFAKVVSSALLLCGAALADTVSTNFEGFTVCSPAVPVFNAMCTVNGQDGWKSALPGEVGPCRSAMTSKLSIMGISGVIPATHPAPYSFGARSLRLSNAYNPAPDTSPPEFEEQTYSTPTKDRSSRESGQYGVHRPVLVHFRYTNAEQPGLRISVSPDNGHGGRMSYIGLDDTPEGIEVTFYDTTTDGDFPAYDLGILPRTFRIRSSSG